MKLDAHEARWSVDSLVLREGNVFSFGWCADSVVPIDKLDLLLEYADGTRETIPTQYGAVRPDVTEIYPDLPKACGYFVYATLSRNEPVKKVWLSLHHADGTCQSLSCSVPTLADQGAAPNDLQNESPWRLSIGDGLRALWSGARKRNGLLCAPGVDEATLRDEFSRLRTETVLILDHSLGGGANKFRLGLVQDFLAAGRDVVVWTFVPSMLQFQIQIMRAGDSNWPTISVAWDAYRHLLASERITEIIFNNCVSYPKPERVPELLLAFKRAAGVQLVLYLHDYYMLCPSHFLLDDSQRFCGIPDLQRCQQCLPRHMSGLARLFKARNIGLWRSLWAEVLAAADEVVCFSHSSRVLLERAYPQLSQQNLVFRPHRMNPSVGHFVYPRYEHGLRVAVVGDIGVHKGSEVVVALLEEAKRQRIDLHVVVVGTLEAQVNEDGLTQTGPYRPENLGSLLNQHAVHLALMPSIWAETFSYVTHELIDLHVPVLAFEFGAQAEAVSAYSRGRVIPLGSAQELLRQIQKFKDKLDANVLQ